MKSNRSSGRLRETQTPVKTHQGRNSSIGLLLVLSTKSSWSRRYHVINNSSFIDLKYLPTRAQQLQTKYQYYS